MKSRDLLRPRLCTSKHESDHRHRRLLRARSDWPSHSSAAKQRNELAPPCMSGKQDIEG
jgi:hypothetical protein